MGTTAADADDNMVLYSGGRPCRRIPARHGCQGLLAPIGERAGFRACGRLYCDVAIPPADGVSG